MATIKQLASFAVLNVNGGDRVTYTFDEIDADTGDLISSNNKGSLTEPKRAKSRLIRSGSK